MTWLQPISLSLTGSILRAEAVDAEASASKSGQPGGGVFNLLENARGEGEEDISRQEI
jgi:hypothetical protein